MKCGLLGTGGRLVKGEKVWYCGTKKLKCWKLTATAETSPVFGLMEQYMLRHLAEIDNLVCCTQSFGWRFSESHS
jgi:hypothetical protein